MSDKNIDDWFVELKAEMYKYGYDEDVLDSIDVEAWRDYYEDGYKPADAFYEDCQNAFA